MKWFLMLLCCVTLSADHFLGDAIDKGLRITYSYSSDNWVMGLSDGSTWKLLPMPEKRGQTWGEWWNRATPKEWTLSDDYFFDPASWGKVTVQVHHAKDTVARVYQHILVNEQTGQKVFAEYIPCGSQFIPKMEFARKIALSGDAQSARAVSTFSFLGDVLALEDCGIYHLHLTKENTQTWSQWWNNVEIDQPDPVFVSTLSDWKRGDVIEVYYAKFTDDALHQKYCVSKPDHEIYLLENRTNNKLAYASSIVFKEFLDAFENYIEVQANKAYEEGFSNGYRAGYQTDAYEEGFLQGVEAGLKGI